MRRVILAAIFLFIPGSFLIVFIALLVRELIDWRSNYDKGRVSGIPSFLLPEDADDHTEEEPRLLGW